MSSEPFKPFENDSQSSVAGPGDGITFENGKNEIIAYGELAVGKTHESAKALGELIGVLERIKAAIEQELRAKPKA